MNTSSNSPAITQLQQAVHRVPDFPVEGVLFEDLTPVLADTKLFSLLIDELERQIVDKGAITKIAGIEARGFIFGAALAQRLGVGFVPIRKAGKLPPPIDTVSYSLEYGEATIEFSQGLLNKDDKILLVDDVLATGGTAKAAKKLIEKQNAAVTQLAVVIDIGFFAGKGSRKLLEEQGLVISSLWIS